MNTPEIIASTLDNQAEASVTRCGFVAIVGRPNVGKSTLFNRLIETHLSPVTHKPQTTRCNIRGILTSANNQIILVDTPGLHRKIYRPLNRVLIDNVYHALSEVDVVVMMTMQGVWLKEDAMVLERIQETGKPCFLVLNKMDLLADKEQILPTLRRVQDKHAFQEIFPLSALKDRDFGTLIQAIASQLPKRKFIFTEGQISDQSERFLVGELIREQAMQELNQELPYIIHLQIDEFKERADIVHIQVTLFVEKEQQRSIVIGTGGRKLKRISMRARKHIESLLGKQVYLRVWVKVKKNLLQTDDFLWDLYFDK